MAAIKLSDLEKTEKRVILIDPADFYIALSEHGILLHTITTTTIKNVIKSDFKINYVTTLY